VGGAGGLASSPEENHGREGESLWGRYTAPPRGSEQKVKQAPLSRYWKLNVEQE
jgi:hypothetical protein